jgi:hypothetical protein
MAVAQATRDAAPRHLHARAGEPQSEYAALHPREEWSGSLSHFIREAHPESIAAGTQLPSRLILWLDDEQAYRNLPASLKRLAVRGLEIRLTANLGPHTKYYPTLEQISEHNLPLVTADDDVLYTRHWLEGLVEAYGQEPGVLHCYRAHQMRIADGRIAPYTHWNSCRSSRPSFLHFATAVSGNILPPRLLQVLREAGTSFRLLCPKADDIWIHMNSLRAGIQTRQLGAWQRNFPLLPGTQDVMLSQANIGSAQNDVQIAKTYAEDELALLRRAADNDPAIG